MQSGPSPRHVRAHARFTGRQLFVTGYREPIQDASLESLTHAAVYLKDSLGFRLEFRRHNKAGHNYNTRVTESECNAIKPQRIRCRIIIDESNYIVRRFSQTSVPG